MSFVFIRDAISQKDDPINIKTNKIYLNDVVGVDDIESRYSHTFVIIQINGTIKSHFMAPAKVCELGQCWNITYRARGQGFIM